METRAKLDGYENIKFAVRTSATVEEWRSLVAHIEKMSPGYLAWPLCGFVDCIKKVLSDLDNTHTSYVTKEEDKK